MMCRPSSLPRRLLFHAVGLLACVVLPLATAGCAGESAGIAFIFPGGTKGAPPPPNPSFNQFDFSLSPMSGDSDEAKQWNSFRTGWNAPTWKASETPLKPLPTIDCPKDSNGWAGFRPAPGAPSQISPYLFVKTTNTEVGDDSVLEGRFPIHVACGREAFSIFLSPPWSLSPWRNAQDDQSLQRLGHRVTRLADGRYVLTGGASRLVIGNRFTLLEAKFNEMAQLIIYEPSSHTIARANVPVLARAFHSAIWNRDSILISGGLDKSGLAPKSYTLRFTGKTKDQLTAQQLEECGEQIALTGSNEVVCLREFTVGDPPAAPIPLAFQKTLRVPESDNAQEAATIQIGGVKHDGANELSNGDFHSLFHAATYLPGKNSVLVTGGFYFNRKEKVFQATNFIYEINIKDRPLKPAAITAVAGMSARAGHTAVRLDDDNVLLIGGVFGVLGLKAANNNEGFGSHTTAELLTRTDSGWTAKVLSADQFPSAVAGRAFHSATMLLPEPGTNPNPAEQLLFVTGGTSWAGSPSAPGKSSTNKPSFLVEIKKENGSFAFRPLVPGGRSQPKNHHIALSSTTMLETGQLLFLGGTKSVSYAADVLIFSAAAPTDSNADNVQGLSALFNPGMNYDPTKLKDAPPTR